MKKKVLFAVLGIILVLLSVFAVIYFTRDASRPADPVEEAMRALEIQTEEGFILTPSEDGSYYCFTGIGNFDGTELIVPAYYNRIPIKEIDITKTEINEIKNIKTISIPDTVQFIDFGMSFANKSNYPFKFNEFENGYYLGNSENPFYALMFYSQDIGSQAVLHTDTKVIAANAFYECHHVNSITLPDGLKSICSGAFYKCTALTDVLIPDSVTFIYKSLFNGCSNLESVTLGFGITEICDRMFYNCISLQSIKINGNITRIGERAFVSCHSLITFEIPSTVTELGNYIFQNSKSLNQIILHKGIKNLTPLSLSETVQYNEYRGGFYLGDTQNPYMYLVGLSDEATESLVLHPDTYSVTQMIIPQTKTLKSLSVEGVDGRYLRSEGNCIIRKEDKALLYGIGTSIIPSKGVKEICDYAFFESNIESIVIPDSVKKIGYGAFAQCASLTSVEIGKNVQELGDSVFSLCTKLEKISLPISLIKIPDHCFSNCYLLNEVTVAKQTEIIGDSAFQDCIALQSISLPGVKVIEARAFTRCEILEKVTLSANLEFIGDYAFHNLDMLEKIILPYGLRHIGKEAFALCGSIKYVNIPKSVESFGKNVYLGCTSLETAIIPGGVKELALCEFQECRNLKTIYLPSTLKKINSNALWRCDSIEQLLFDGTLEEWNAIEKSVDWNRDTPAFKVTCTDGEVEHSGDDSEYVSSY